jgi:hypothetical protein
LEGQDEAAVNVMRLYSRHNQQNTKTISAAAFVQCGACERPLYTNVPNMMWVCAFYRVSPLTTQKQILKQFYYNKRACVCVRCVVTEEQLKVPRNLCSSQNYVSKKIFTLHFMYCMQ